MSEQVECPKCKEIIQPDVYRTGKMIISIECPECGYDMKKEIMEVLQ